MLKGLACAKKKKKNDLRKTGRPIGKYVCACSVAQSCLTLCDPLDCSLPGSSVHGIFFCLSPDKNTGVGFHFLLQGDLPNPRIKHRSPAPPTLAGKFFTTELPGKPHLGRCFLNSAKRKVIWIMKIAIGSNK